MRAAYITAMSTAPRQSLSSMPALWNIIDTGDEGDSGDLTPLMISTRTGTAAAVAEFLLQQPGLDISCPDSHGRTAAHWASNYGRADILAMLLAAPSLKGSLNTRDSWGHTPLGTAVSCGQVECVRLLAGVPGVSLDTSSGQGLEWQARWVLVRSGQVGAC